MSKKLLPYDEQLLDFINFTILNTDSFELETKYDGVQYVIYKSYEDYSCSTKSVLSISNYSSLGKRNEGETLTIHVGRKSETIDDISEEQWDGFYPKKHGYRNECRISFEKISFPHSSLKKLEDDESNVFYDKVQMDLNYDSSWTESKKDWQLFTLASYLKEPSIHFKHSQTISSSSKFGEEKKVDNGYSDSSFKKIAYDVGGISGKSYLFEEDGIRDIIYGNKYFYSDEDLSTFQKVIDGDGNRLPSLSSMEQESFIKDLYHYYSEMCEKYPWLKVSENKNAFLSLVKSYSSYFDYLKEYQYSNVLDVIRYRESLIQELNDGVGFTREVLNHIRSCINDKVPIHEMSHDNVLVKAKKQSLL